MRMFAKFFGLTLFVTACQWDPNETKLQWMPDMADSPTVKPQEDFLNPPEHSISNQAILYPTLPEEAAKVFINPISASDDVLAKGKLLYETQCYVCHGTEAKGDGPIVDVYVKPPDLTGADYIARPDGRIFHVITFGQNSMPGYGYAVTPLERWQIVHYLRTLQKKAG